MEFWRFITPDDLGLPLVGSHDYILVFLSICFASLASLAALSVVERILILRQRSAEPQHLWHLAGAFAMGSGVWAMHFTGMMAYELPITMHFNLTVTILSVFPVLIASWFALGVRSNTSITWWRLQLGGLLLAVGIGSMHFLGMEAMILDAEMRYDFWLFSLSIVVAHILASFALYVRFAITSNNNHQLFRLISAIVMGCAVSRLSHINVLK